MQDTGELVRPYAIAAFQQAEQEGKLSEWSEMLALFDAIVRDPVMAALIVNPKADTREVTDLIIDVGGEQLSSSVRNLIRLLADNGKLSLAPQLVDKFNAERARREGRSDVSVASAFELSAEQQGSIADAMKKRLGTNVTLSVSIDKALIGGVVIRAGDLVIDASLRGRLKQLSQTLV